MRRFRLGLGSFRASGFGGSRGSRRPRRRRRSVGIRRFLETLEDRTLLSGGLPVAVLDTPRLAVVLLVVGNEASLDLGDSALIQRLESNDRAVTIVDDDNVTAQDALGRDLVLVSQTVSAVKIGSTFTTSTTPLISNESMIFDDLGMTGQVAGVDFGRANGQMQVTLSSPDHFLAAGLSATVDVFGSNDRLGWGVPNQSAVRVANLVAEAGRSVLFAYDAGAKMPDLAAPARRVGFFPDNNGPTKFTTEAWSLFDAAVEWAINTSPRGHNDSYRVDWNGTLTVPAVDGVLVNDFDDGAFQAVLDTGTGHGSLAFRSDGSFEYTAEIGFAGIDQFTYMADDGIDASDPVTVTIMVNEAPNGHVLLVVGNEAELGIGDSALWGRLIADGHAVTVVDDDHVRAADAGGRDLVLVSQTVSSVKVGITFTRSTTPVISNESMILDDMGMTGGVMGVDFGRETRQTQVTFRDGEDFLAAGLSGTVDVFGSNDRLGWGVPSGTAVTVATLTGDPSRSTVFAYEAGARMFGLTAPARRVGFFVDGDGPAKFTPEGWSLFDAAVRWAIGKPPQRDVLKPSQGEVLLVVGNAAILDPGDATLIQRLKSNNLAVTLVDDDNVTARHAEDRDLVLVSQTVSAAKVGSTFTASTTPVISHESMIFDDLGMTGGTSRIDFGRATHKTEVTINRADHLLAAGLSGSLRVFVSMDRLGWGVPNQNAVAVASLGSDSPRSVLFGYEAGAEMPGLTAPARRVGFFPDNNGPTKFTREAWLLFDAAVAWAINGSAESGGPSNDPSTTPPPEKDESGPFPKPAVAEVFATAETEGVEFPGDRADDPAIWVHPTDPSLSLIIGTNKDKKNGGLLVYDLDGREFQFLRDGKLNNVDLRYRFMLGEDEIDIVTVSNRTTNAIDVYQVLTEQRRLTRIGSIQAGIPVYGYAMYHSRRTGKFYGIVNSKAGEVQQWEIFAQGDSQIAGRKVREFDVGSQVEGIVADDELGMLYIGEQDVGVWKYGAEPEDGQQRTLVDSTGPEGHLTADVEGLTLYYRRDGLGYLIASSQGSSEYVVYRREGNNEYLGTFVIGQGTIDEVTKTDGIDVTNISLGSAYPHGVFVVQDNRNDTGNQNYKLVSWEQIAADDKLGLAIDTNGWDVRGESGPGSVGNRRPLVDAGAEQVFHMNSLPGIAVLDGSVTDDGPPDALSSTWSMVRGPGTVTFADPSAIDTTADFDVAGTYVLRLRADDGQLTASDIVTVNVTGPTDILPQFEVKQTPRLQLGDAPLIGFAGSETDQIEILWQTVSAGAGTQDSFLVQYRRAEQDAWSTAAEVRSIDTGVESRIVHSVELDGLAFDTDYEYRVRHLRGGIAIANYQASFHTRLPAGDESAFTFVAYGGSAYTPKIDRFRRVQDGINRTDAAFALLLGDNVYGNGSHPESDARFDATVNPEAAAWNAGQIDYFAVGKHDVDTDDGQPSRDNFSVPIPVAGVTAAAAPSSETEWSEHNYSFDYGSVHFVTFDSNSYRDESRLRAQLDWLQADLRASAAQWKIVFTHMPVAGTPDKQIDPAATYYQQVVPRLRAAGVDLLLGGRSHTYGWTYPLLGSEGGQPTFVPDTDKDYAKGQGLVQLVAGVGGKSLHGGDYGDFPYYAAGFTETTTPRVEYGFAQIEVTGNQLSVSYLAADDGTVIDAFTITDPNAAGDPPPTDPVSSVDGVTRTADLTSTVDTMILSNSPEVASGSALELETDGSPEQAVLLAWDLGSIAAGSRIESASISLHITNKTAELYEIYEVLRPWSESEATWLQPVAGLSWEVPGADGDSDRGSIILGELTAPEVGPVTIALNADGIALVQKWVDNPQSNHGLVIQDYEDASNGVAFDSRETSIADRRPMLSVMFVPPDADVEEESPESRVGSPGAGVAGPNSALDSPEIPAFPGAEGYAATATGGRGGRVLEVTNTNDSGPGSLRAAVEATGSRIVVFKVGGEIALSSGLEIREPDITIAGQTAPGDGITLSYSGPIGDSVLAIRTNNVIIRYLRLRRGESGNAGDSLHIHDGSSNVIIDHASITWATDENLDIYSAEGGSIRDITVQNSLIAAALDTDDGAPLGALLSGNKNLESWRRVSRIDLHDNVIANNTHRNPRVITRGTKIVNNIVYNWASRAGSTERDTLIDWIGNHFIRGPMSNTDDERLLFHGTTSPDLSTVYEDASIFIEGNIAPSFGFTSPSQDNWAMLRDHYVREDGRRVAVPLRMRRDTPLPDPEIPITISDPGGSFDDALLDDVGANRRLNCDGTWTNILDPIDARIVSDVRNRTGPTLGTLPSSSAEASRDYAPTEVSDGCADADTDGMPDVWEESNNFDTHDASDGNADADGDGWTNVEEYLNGTNPLMDDVHGRFDSGTWVPAERNVDSLFSDQNQLAIVLGDLPH